jgi:hypothetical protein
MQTKGESVLQTAILFWIVLRSMNVIPNLELYVPETFFQVIIGLILLAISYFNPLLGILSTILLLINLKPSVMETMFICIDEESINDILSTIDEEKPRRVDVSRNIDEENFHPKKTKPEANSTPPPPPKKTKPEANSTPPPPKKTKPEANSTPPPRFAASTKTNEECDEKFLITPVMLHRAQTNVYDENNISLFFNETGYDGVNIQGIYESITGYDPNF